MNMSCVETLQVAASGCKSGLFKVPLHVMPQPDCRLLPPNSSCFDEERIRNANPKGRKALPSGSNLSNLPGSEPSLSTFWSLVLPQDMIFAIHRAIGAVHCEHTIAAIADFICGNPFCRWNPQPEQSKIVPHRQRICLVRLR